MNITKNEEVNDILKKLETLIARLDPMYDYTEEGEDKSAFTIMKEVSIEMINDAIKEFKKNIPELKKTLLYYLNDEFKESIEETLAKGRTEYNKNIKPSPDNIEDLIEDLRVLYSQELPSREYFHAINIRQQAEDFSKYTAKERKLLKMPKEFTPVEFDEMKDPVLVELQNKFDKYLTLYEKLLGKKYKKSLIINRKKEDAEKAIRKDKEDALKAREELLARQRAEKEARKPKKSRKQLEQEKYGVSGTIPENVSILDDIDKKLTSYSVPAKVKKGLFSDIKDLVSSIVEEETKSEEYYDKNGKLLTREDLKKICQKLEEPPIQVIPKSSTFKPKQPKSRMDKIAETLKGLQPQYPEREGNRDRTGKLLTQEEVDRLIRVRASLAKSKIPKNEIVEEKAQELEYDEPVPVVKRRGRPPNPNSKRQQALKAPVKVEEVKPEPKKRGPKPNPESKRQKELAKKQEPAPPTDEPKKRGRPKKAPEEKSRPPPKKESVGRPKKCDEVKPKLDNLQPYGLREDKRTITKADIFSIPFVTKKGTRYEVNYRLLMNINATPIRFVSVLDRILNKFNLKIDNERTKAHRKSFLEDLEGLSSSGRKRASTYKKITQFLIAKGITTAYDIEHEFTQEILNDLNEKTDPSKLVAFENYVEKNCIDKPKQEPKQEVKQEVKPKKEKQSKEPKQPQKDPSVTFNEMIDNIKNYSNEFKKAEQPSLKTIVKIAKDIWSKPENNTLRFKDGKIEAYTAEEDENGKLINSWDNRPINSVAVSVLNAITEAYDIPELDEYLKNKENKTKLKNEIIDVLENVLDKVGGRLLKNNEPVPRRYK